MTRRRYILMHDERVFARTDSLALVAGWLSGDGGYSACDTLTCFDTPCAYCIAAGAPLDDVHDAPLVPVREYLGELEDVELAMHENGSWGEQDEREYVGAFERVAVLGEDAYLFLRPWRGVDTAVGPW